MERLVLFLLHVNFPVIGFPEPVETAFKEYPHTSRCLSYSN